MAGMRGKRASRETDTQSVKAARTWPRARVCPMRQVLRGPDIYLRRLPKTFSLKAYKHTCELLHESLDHVVSERYGLDDETIDMIVDGEIFVCDEADTREMGKPLF
jgi:hypothetical protein